MRESNGKKIKVTLIDGSVLTGMGNCYTPAQDNPEVLASLCVDNVIFFENEYKKIERIN